MAIPDPLVLKRNESINRERTETNSLTKADNVLSFNELLKSSTVPLWNTPYERQVCFIQTSTNFVHINQHYTSSSQLQIKMDRMRSVLKDLAKELKIANKLSPCILKLLEDRCAQYDGLPCELSDIRHAPEESIVNGYRNKCEFTIGEFEMAFYVSYMTYFFNSLSRTEKKAD